MIFGHDNKCAANKYAANEHAVNIAISVQRMSDNATDLTVVISTYNGAARIGAVLDCLRNQINTDGIKWEAIVVDNNSSDDTPSVVRQHQATWPDSSSLRYEFEPQQGAGFARHCGAKVASGSLIGYLDDDNLPYEDWIYEACKFAAQHPKAGAFGSRVYGKFSQPPPENFSRIGAFLALTDRGSKPIPYKPEAKILPPGAGLVVRRQAWLDNVPDKRTLSEKFGEREAGEDIEVVLRIQNAGWEVWYNPSMQLHHDIPPFRLTRDYLIRLFRGIGLSRYHTRMLSFPTYQRPFVLLPYMLNDGRKILLHVARHRQKVVTDTVTASEMTLYLASLASPFYSWYRMGKRQLLKASKKIQRQMI